MNQGHLFFNKKQGYARRQVCLAGIPIFTTSTQWSANCRAIIITELQHASSMVQSESNKLTNIFLRGTHHSLDDTTVSGSVPTEHQASARTRSNKCIRKVSVLFWNEGSRKRCTFPAGAFWSATLSPAFRNAAPKNPQTQFFVRQLSLGHCNLLFQLGEIAIIDFGLLTSWFPPSVELRRRVLGSTKLRMHVCERRNVFRTTLQVSVESFHRGVPLVTLTKHIDLLESLAGHRRCSSFFNDAYAFQYIIFDTHSKITLCDIIHVLQRQPKIAATILMYGQVSWTA